MEIKQEFVDNTYSQDADIHINIQGGPIFSRQTLKLDEKRQINGSLSYKLISENASFRIYGMFQFKKEFFLISPKKAFPNWIECGTRFVSNIYINWIAIGKVILDILKNEI